MDDLEGMGRLHTHHHHWRLHVGRVLSAVCAVVLRLVDQGLEISCDGLIGFVLKWFWR
jgi:hypothetical protein